MVEAEIEKELGNLRFSEIFIEETNEPMTNLGIEHDIFINNKTLEVFKKTNNTWEFKGLLGELPVNPDWDETNPESRAYIFNKPDNLVYQNILDAVEEDLEIQITNLETLINQQGVIGFDYDSESRTLSIIRSDNEVEANVELPLADGLQSGFISMDDFLEFKGKINSSEKGQPNGVAILDSDGKVPLSELPIDNELFVVVNNLNEIFNPTNNKIYLVPKSGSNGNVYDEYVYVNNDWELIGSLEIDLSNYYTKTEINNSLSTKQDTLISGNNIKTINNDSLLGNGNITIDNSITLSKLLTAFGGSENENIGLVNRTTSLDNWINSGGSTDMNSVTRTGFYIGGWGYSGWSNLPSGVPGSGVYCMLVISDGNYGFGFTGYGSVLQLLWYMGSAYQSGATTASNIIYTRSLGRSNGQGWTEWEKIVPVSV
jgi:hypothetical protein